MAKFTGKNIEFKDGQKAIFGDADDAYLTWDNLNQQMVVSTVISGVYPTADGHLTTKFYVDTIVSGISFADTFISLADTPNFYDDGMYLRSTASGLEWTTISGSGTGYHGDLTGLDEDDHLQYVPTDGSRGFTNTVSGIDPIEDYELATKLYVDTTGVYPRYYIEPELHINVHDWGQYVIHDTALEVAGALELGTGGMLILT
jgi:hypothetical protein